MADNKNLLNDDDLDMVTGGRNLLYTGEKVDKYNGLMDDSVSVEKSDLVYRQSPANTIRTKNTGAPKGMIC